MGQVTPQDISSPCKQQGSVRALHSSCQAGCGMGRTAQLAPYNVTWCQNCRKFSGVGSEGPGIGFGGGRREADEASNKVGAAYKVLHQRLSAQQLQKPYCKRSPKRQHTDTHF